jgi:hypothetical protein
MARKTRSKSARVRARGNNLNKTGNRTGKRRRRTPELAPGASRFRLRVARSPIQGFGVFADESIPKQRKVIEYTGKRMSVREYDRETAESRARRRMRVCFFCYTRRWGVDGAIGGSGAELINHGCEPNIKVRKMRGHILYFSCRRIRAGEELLVDYHIDPRTVKYQCNCGSPKCRGTINCDLATLRKVMARRTSKRRARRRARKTNARRPGN